jgi:prepilin-type N-terminal cleavage/methylation domain-containing protein
MNMFKKNGGFTLVELIVVIAILAILAAVAVPAYNGYIKKANNSAVETSLTGYSTAVIAANAEVGPVASMSVSADGKTLTITGATATNFKTNFDLFAAPLTATADDSVAGKYTVTLSPANAWAGSEYNTKGATYGANGWAVTPKSGT